MRYKFESEIMMKKLGLICACLCFYGLAGCVSDRSYLEEDCENGICTSEQEYREVCTETPDGYSICEDAPVTDNVNYTRTQADFRKYGERTPRDHRITQAAAGNNISASIPPSINDEVLDYEEEVMLRDGSMNTAYVETVSENSPAQQEKAENSAEQEDATKDWLAEEGQSLKQLLTEWSEESGWRLIWKTNRNYTLNAGAMFRGNFADVSSALIRAFARARPAPVATFYKGNRVLVIETMEDENAYD